MPSRMPARVQERGHDGRCRDEPCHDELSHDERCPRLSMTKLARRSAERIAAITIPLTCHVVPKYKASRLTTCVSSSRNPAPMLKKNREGTRLRASGIWK